MKLGRFMHYKRITLYDVQAHLLLNEDAVELGPMASGEIDDESTSIIVQELTYNRWPRVWKGSCLGVVELDDGSKQRIAISYYGGFFKVLGDDGYYETHGKSREELERAFARVLKEDFIPARQRTSEKNGEDQENGKK